MNRQKASDAKLLAASIQDAAAFRALYDRYAERIQRYFVRRCRDEEAALDLLAETFAQAWKVRARFRDEADGSAGPWLFGIARNVLLQSVRRQRLEDGARQRLGMREGADQPQSTPAESWLDGVDELLQELSPPQRAAVELRVIDDLSYRDVAARLQITPETARARVHRALRRLRNHDLMTGELR